VILLRPGLLLLIEGAAVLALALLLYARNDGPWLLFILLFLAPDLSFIAYLAGSRVGAAVYNTVHTYTVPAAVGIAGLFSESGLVVWLALIWAAHIVGDRLLGYGLKYPTAFKDTHLGQV
jgi:hypothetical protein